MSYLLWLQTLRGSFLDSVLMTVTDFVVSPAMYIFVAVLYWCFSKRAAIFLAMNLSFGSLLNQTLKNIFCVYRPWIYHPEFTPYEPAKVGATGYSFPSGHTQIAAAEFLSIADWQRKRKSVVIVCVVMTLLVMFTRNYLGVHTLQDVVASLVLSVLVIGLNRKLFSWVDGGKHRDLWLVGVGILVTTLLLVFLTAKSYPMDYAPDGVLLVDPNLMITDCYLAAGCVYGFLTGWILERRLLRFTVEVSAKAKLFRTVFGAVILFIYATFARDIFVQFHAYWGELIFIFVAFVYILFLYPALFAWVEKLMHKRKK